jgi:hypothetical protein
MFEDPMHDACVAVDKNRQRIERKLLFSMRLRVVFDFYFIDQTRFLNCNKNAN